MMGAVNTVAILGLGAMGSRLAGRFLQSGHQIIVWNRTPEKASSLVDLGAALAESPADATRRSEVIITMVSDPGALRDVTEGLAGVASGADGSKTLIEMSTVGPAAIARLASILPKDVELLDAPVLGSVAEAESGSLTVFAGGRRDAIEQWTPLLSELGSVIHVGPLGNGAAAKLVANLTLFGVLGALGEALALAQRAGLSRETAYRVLAATPLAAQAERRRPSIESGEYPRRYSLSLARKDAGLILETSGGADLRLVAAMRTWIEEAEKSGWGERDYSAVLAWIMGERATSE